MPDPGFAVGRRRPHRGRELPRQLNFEIFFMSKRKNLDPWGRAPGTPPRSANASWSVLLYFVVATVFVDFDRLGLRGTKPMLLGN